MKLSANKPIIMGIINVTPDSFYENSRANTIDSCLERATQMLNEGADIIDVGGFSTRPNHETISEEEEYDRVMPAICALRNHFPKAAISIDTFRANIAKEAVEKYEVDIINDVTAGLGDCNMIDIVSQLHTDYILTCNKQSIERYLLANGQNGDETDYVSIMVKWFNFRIDELRQKNINNIIVDPGIGFHGNNILDFAIIKRLKEFKCMSLPILVGVSNKSVIYNTLKTTPTKSQNGTTILNTISLLNGADILRVHDIKSTVELRSLMQQLQTSV